MRLLLDENLPGRLKQDLSEFEVYTIKDKGWTGKSNGELLKLMVAEQFDALITFDKNLQYQQNFTRYSLTVLVLNASDNSYEVVRRLIPQMKQVLSQSLKAGPVEIKE